MFRYIRIKESGARCAGLRIQLLQTNSVFAKVIVGVHTMIQLQPSDYICPLCGHLAWSLAAYHKHHIEAHTPLAQIQAAREAALDFIAKANIALRAKDSSRTMLNEVRQTAASLMFALKTLKDEGKKIK